MKYTQVPSDMFKKIQMNAGILTNNFNPSTRTLGDILGATSGGCTFSAVPTYVDNGEDVDNCPKNTMELKRREGYEVKMSGTFVSVSANLVKSLIGSADTDDADDTHIVPRNDLLTTDFSDIWWIGDYSDVNTGDKAGFMAIHVMNALNTAGFKIQSGDKSKGQFAFEYTGHYSIDSQSVVPFEIYIVEGEE